LAASASGEVVTFYSYKGGTGRTMALVNCAGLIASALPSAARPLLLIDFDLEAPGIHQYLNSWPPYADDYRGRAGTLELFEELGEEIEAAMSRLPEAQCLDDEYIANVVKGIDLARFITEVPGLPIHAMCAGRATEDYDTRLAAISWDRLFAQAPSLFRALAARFAETYSLTFVDSRTGLTDTGGICSMLLPDALVVVFTPNHQSLTGIEHLMNKASRYRSESTDLRPLRIYPLASRVDTTTEHFRTIWRQGGSAAPIFGDVRGYQPMFTETFERSAGISAAAQRALGAYFDRVQIPHSADYAFGERLCFVPGTSADTLSVRSSYEQFLPWLLTRSQPWDDPAAVRRSTQVREQLDELDAALAEAKVDAPRRLDLLSSFPTRLDEAALQRFDELAPDVRATLSFAMSLAAAAREEFPDRWLDRLAEAWSEDISPQLPTSAIATLLDTWAASGLRRLHFADPIRQWVTLWHAGFYRRLATLIDRRTWLGAALRLANVGQWEAFAIDLARELHAVEASVNGDTHPRALETKAALAKLLANSGQEAEAQHLQADLVSESEAVFGSNAPETLDARRRLGATMRSRGSLAEAHHLLTSVLADMTRVLGPHHRASLETSNSLALTLEAMGDLEGARALHENNVERYEAHFDRADPDHLVARSNLGLTLLELGYVDRALQLLEEVLATRRRHPSEDPLAVLEAVSNLAAACGVADDRARSRTLLLELVRARSDLLGDLHPDTLAAKCDLAETLRTDGDIRDAFALHKQVLAGRQESLGDMHKDTLRSCLHTANCLDELERYDEEIEVYGNVLPLLDRVFGPLDPETLTARSNLALTLELAGRSEESVALLRGVLQARRETLGAEHAETLGTLRDLGLVLTRNSCLEEGVSLLQASFDVALSRFGAGNAATAGICIDLASSALEANRPDVASTALDQVPRPHDRDWVSLRLDAATRLGDEQGAARYQAQLLELHRSERRPSKPRVRSHPA
jgi:tetratricopeptide (TPR) repeat protein/cellulose biosynthesis protein BcsQ